MRGDPVPLHEQVRSQRRAVLAGIVLGLLAIAAVAGHALVSPAPDWTREAIVMGRSSGALYVVAHRPDRLVPVTNLAAARLVLAALARGGAASAGAGPAVPVPVDDAQLAAAPRTPVADVPGAVAVLPEGPGIPPSWAVCDEYRVTGGSVAVTATVVVAGAHAGGDRDPALFLAAPDGTEWVVLDGVRHRIPPRDTAVRTALGLGAPRPASAALASAFPEGPPLATPVIPAGPGPAAVPADSGDVLVSQAASGAQRYWVVLPSGIQEIPPLLADVLVAARGAPPRPVGVDVITAAPTVDGIDVTPWPATAPRIREPAETPVACWAWSEQNRAGYAVTAGSVPAAPQGVRVELAQADGSGPRVDAVLLPASGPGPVRADSAGGYWLVSAAGVAYPVADEDTAAALGISHATPAPDAALRLLPTGPTLDLADAVHVVDVVHG